MKIFYITDVSQLSDFFSDIVYSESFIPLTGDISVAYELIKKNVHFFNEWDFLSNEEIQRNFDLANDISKKWWVEFSFKTLKSDDTFFSTTQQDMVYFFEAALNSKSLYSSLFLKYNISEIHGYFLKEQAVIRTGPNPTHRAVRSIAQSVLFWLCKKKSIPVIQLKSNASISIGTLI